MEYTDKADVILEAIRDSELEPGMYALGQAASTDSVDVAHWEENSVGKSWGVLNYQAKQPGMEIMTTNLIRGFTIDFVIMFLLFSMMAKVNAVTIKDALFVTIGIGFISFLVEPYIYY